MKKIDVLAFEDRSRPEGGHAVILLAGLKQVPSRPAFRLRMVDENQAGAGRDPWFDGEQLPVTARVTADGIALVIGPDVAEHPMLIPGSVVEIEMADADVRGEFLWPTIAPLQRPKRKSILTKGALREDRVETSRGAERAPELATAAPAAASPATPSEPRAIVPPRPSAAPGPIVASSGLPVRQADLARPDNAKKEHAEMSASSTNPPTGAREPAAAETSGARATEPVEATSPPPREDGDFVAFYPHARGSRLKPAERKRTSTAKGLGGLMPTTPMGMLVAIAVGVAAIQSALYLAQNNSGPPPHTASLLIAPAPAPAATEAGPAGATPGTLYEALNTGPVSPRGVNARDATAGKALETAHSLLQGSGNARDAEEGAFWLKRYLAGTIGDERTLRALAHLGSTYANPAGRAPDYAKASLMWELAGALGDPVAMCFLSMVHDNGLGVARDRKQAQQWHDRAKQSGGCPDLEDAIARARQ